MNNSEISQLDTIFFWASKLVWHGIKPDTLLLVSIFLTVVLLWTQHYHAAGILLTSIAFCLLVLSFIPLGKILLHPLETRFQTNPSLPQKVDGMVVLSGAVNAKRSRRWQQTEFGGAAERYLMFQQLAKRYPEAKLVFTGGSGDLMNQKDREADIAKQFFGHFNLDVTKILFERDARNTYENALFSKAIVQPERGETWILITSASHMPRSVGVFCKQAWKVIPYPVDHQTDPHQNLFLTYNLGKNLDELQSALREWTGLVAYYLSGKTTAFFPAECIL